MNEFQATDIVVHKLVEHGYRMNTIEWLAFKHLAMGAAMVLDAKELSSFIDELHDNEHEVVANYKVMHDSIMNSMKQHRGVPA
jgi:hypothetical protein